VKTNIQDTKHPVLLGERDVIKTIQLLPESNRAGEGIGGFMCVASGRPNLILLDETPFIMPHTCWVSFHLNSDAIKNN